MHGLLHRNSCRCFWVDRFLCDHSATPSSTLWLFCFGLKSSLSKGYMEEEGSISVWSFSLMYMSFACISWTKLSWSAGLGKISSPAVSGYVPGWGGSQFLAQIANFITFMCFIALFVRWMEEIKMSEWLMSPKILEVLSALVVLVCLIPWLIAMWTLSV